MRKLKEYFETCFFMALLLLLSMLLFTLPNFAHAQVSPTITIGIRDEGVFQGYVRTLNCTGAGIACSVSGLIATVNVAGGGGGGGNFVEASVDLSTNGGLIYTATVTGQAWVTAGSLILCSPFATTADGQELAAYQAAGFTVNAQSRVVGTGFDVSVYNPHGATGIFRFHCTGS